MDLRFDYDRYSVNNILNDYINMDYEMAYAIHLSAKRQILRENIKKELHDYFSHLYINGKCESKRCRT